MYIKRTLTGALMLLTMVMLYSPLNAAESTGVVRISDQQSQSIQQTGFCKSLSSGSSWNGSSCNECGVATGCCTTEVPDCGCPEVSECGTCTIPDCGCPETTECGVCTVPECGVCTVPDCGCPEIPDCGCPETTGCGCTETLSCGSATCCDSCSIGCCNECVECEKSFCQKYHEASCHFIGRNQAQSRALFRHLSHSIDRCFRRALGEDCGSCYGGCDCNSCYGGCDCYGNGNCYGNGDCYGNGYGNGNCPNGSCPNGGGSKHCYLAPEGSGGTGTPLHGCYNMVYSANPTYFDQRDAGVYAAQGYGFPVAVPLAPNVKQAYNYSWGVPSSRISRVSRPLPPYAP